MKKVKGYKAFNKDMTCQGFQFEEGKTYKEDKAEICKSGFHFCTDPWDVLNYYNICESEFAEIETAGKIDKQSGGDSKKCTTKIKIVVKLGLSGFIDTSIKFLLDFCKTNDKNKKSGIDSKQAASGDYSTQAASGSSSKQAASGLSSTQAASGLSSKQAASGLYSTQAASGDSSKQAASGLYSTQAASGDSSKQELKGKYSVAMAAGRNSKIKAKKGCWITLAEWEYNNKENVYIPICVKSAQIDGKKLKEDVFYTLKNKKFVEA